MIVDERMVTYMNSLDKGNTPFLNHLEQEALKNRVPIIRREMQSFLKVLLQIKAPKRILEVGTAVGFSTLLMSTYNPADCEIVTIENYEKRIPIAKENFRKAGKEEQITLNFPHWFFSHGEALSEWINPAIEEFEKENPNIKINGYAG